MRHSLLSALLLGTAALFQGCGGGGSASEPEIQNGTQAVPLTRISGKSTLASDRTGSTTVCLDMNGNGKCDVSEPSTATDEKGSYLFETEENVPSGTWIIVQNGVSIIPLPDNNETRMRHMKFYKSYQPSEGEQNVNMVSTLIARRLAARGDGDYQAALDDFAKRYPGYIGAGRIDKEDLILDPVDEAEGVFGFFGSDELLHFNAAMQSIGYGGTPSSVSRAAAVSDIMPDLNIELGNYLPTEEELDRFYDSSSSYFSELDAYIDQFLTWVSAWADDTQESESTQTEDNSSGEEEATPEVVEVPVTRSSINGVWYIIDASGDRTCSVIDEQDNISVTESDGKTTDLVLQFDEKIRAMTLKLGFFTADTIVFDRYWSDGTFEGHYDSDGEEMQGLKMGSLISCKNEKLGL